MLKRKNIIILVVIGAVLVLAYIFFMKSSPATSNLISATAVSVPDASSLTGNTSVAKDFLTLLLNVKNIKLNDTIFSDKAFISLRDSSITLTSDGSEGRSNPFAPLGTDNISTSSLLPVLSSDISPVSITTEPTVTP